ncbi:MAG: DUF3662 and FHA domain-containing protein [Chloroflexota bacterium]|nr:DUF3662 and FHA domain-containing protein [Chloroflexota bacterium]
MQALERFEGFVERLMEGSFARLFRSPIQPAEVAKRLEREMEAHPTISIGRTYVPNHYEVSLNPEDFAEFEPFRHSLEHNMAEFITDLAGERGYSLVARPNVTLQPSSTVPKRGIEVTARLSDAPASTTAGTQRVGESATRRERSAAAEPPLAPTHSMPQVAAMRPGPIGVQSVQGGQGVPATMGAVMPRAALVPLEGDLAGREFEVAKTLLTIGRGLDNELVIDDPRVSRHHAQVTFRHSHYLLRDLRSTNGTFVNNQPVEAVVLASGDLLSIGGFELRFQQE